MFSFQLHSYAAGEQTLEDIKFCEKELEKAMNNLLEDDKQNILSDAYNLASYKLAYNIQKDGGAGDTLEKFIKKKAKQISENDKTKIINRVHKLYKKFGLSSDLGEISKSIEGLTSHNYFPASQRLSNQEHSIILLAFKELKPCQNICITEEDAAVTWFMGEVVDRVKPQESDSSKTNLMQMSVKVAHLNGGLSSTEVIPLEELEQNISSLENSVNSKINKTKIEFFEKFSTCKDLQTNKCFQKILQASFPKSLRNILDKINSNSISGINKDLKVKLTDNLTLNLSNSLKHKRKEPIIKEAEGFPNKVKLPAIIVNSEKGPGMCSGEPFEPKIKDVKLWSFDPLKAIAIKNNYGKPGKLPGSQIGMLCELLKLGPIQFHCTPWLKKFVLRKKDAKALVCCEDNRKWEEFTNLFASINGGLDLKAYLGVPFLSKIGINAEVGIIGGFGAGFSIGGGAVPEGCIKKNCIQAAVRTSVFLGGYLDFGVKRKVNSAVGGEFKVSWKPYLTSRQCLYPQNKLPPLEIKYSIGSLWLHGTVYAGWVLSYDFYEPIYESNDEDSLSIPIF